VQIVGATGSFEEIGSSEYALQRADGGTPTPPGPDDNDDSSSDDDDDSTPWWAWFLLALGLVALAVLGVWFFLRWRNNRKRNNSMGTGEGHDLHQRNEAPLLDTEYASFQNEDL
jgi:hypothetical protein